MVQSLLRQMAMELLHSIQNTTLEISLFAVLVYLLCVTFCILSQKDKLALLITYVFSLYCLYACNKEVMVQTFGDSFHLFNFLFFGFGVLVLAFVIYMAHLEQ